MRFHDRTEAGRLLAAKLQTYANHPNISVLALPRGGVQVAFELARALNALLDVFIVHKFGLPGNQELTVGAIATGGVCFLHEDLVRALAIPEDVLYMLTAKEWRKLERRERLYRGLRSSAEVCGRTVILVDDGLAPGCTLHAAAAALRQQQAARIIVAVPVGPRDTCEELRHVADEMVFLCMPENFLPAGSSYEEFSPTTDEEVRVLLRQAASERFPARHAG